jgi:phage major head subunit gpT-like protein
MINTSNFAELLEPGLRKIYGDSYNDYPEEYSKVFAVDSSSKNKEYDQEISTLGLVPVKTQGSGISYSDPSEGYKKTYTHTAYGLGFQITRELWEDALYRNIKAMPSALARSVRQTVEYLAASHLNYAFTASAAYYGSDGKELCATDHPLSTGATSSNELSTAADLDITSYEQALIDIQGMVDSSGLKIAARPKRLIVAPANVFQAQMILKSSMLPDTANNNYNPAQGTMPGGYVVMHWLTDDDAWFIQTDIPNGLTWFWRRRPEFTKDNDWDSENAKFKTTFRASSGWSDWRGIFGSPGA